MLHAKPALTNKLHDDNNGMMNLHHLLMKLNKEF